MTQLSQIESRIFQRELFFISLQEQELDILEATLNIVELQEVLNSVAKNNVPVTASLPP